jgi:hypothetical protein
MSEIRDQIDAALKAIQEAEQELFSLASVHKRIERGLYRWEAWVEASLQDAETKPPEAQREIMSHLPSLVQRFHQFRDSTRQLRTIAEQVAKAVDELRPPDGSRKWPH